MAEESAYTFAVNLFKENRADDFFKPAFKPFSYDVTTTTGSPYGGGTTTTTTYSAVCQEVGGAAKQKELSYNNSIQSTDIMVKGLYEEITPPELGKQFTFNSQLLTVVSVGTDPVGATFTVFGRGS